MWVLLPLLTVFFLVRACRPALGQGGWLEAAVRAFLILGVAIVLSTELLSALHLLNPPAVKVAWLLMAAMAGGGAWRARRWDGGGRLALRDPVAIMTAGIVVLLGGLVLVTAMVYPPNNHDVLVYHLPRVMHWMDAQRIILYPTAITRQNFQPPLAEFALLHLFLLGGGDRWVNLVQVAALGASVCTAVRLAQTLGFRRPAPALAALLTATVPTLVLQASTPKNDVLLGAFVGAFALYLFRMRTRPNWREAAFAGCALGLALLTKGTALLYCAGVAGGAALAIGGRWWRFDARRLAACGGCAVLALILVSGHWIRLWSHYGSLFPPEEVGPYANTRHDLGTLEGNLLRNLALHAMTPWTRGNSEVAGAVVARLGTDLNDPGTTWRGTEFAPYYSRHEDLAGNWPHALLLLVAAPLGVWAWRRKPLNRVALAYAAGAGAGALLFCWALRWQPWAARLHSPLFVLAAPLIAGALAGPRSWQRFAAWVVVAPAIYYGFGCAWGNPMRSLRSGAWMVKPRAELYLPGQEERVHEYQQALAAVAGPMDGAIGLCVGPDDPEYIFWMLAQRGPAGKSPHFRHVEVENRSRDWGDKEEEPRYVIATRDLERWERDRRYCRLFATKRVGAFARVAPETTLVTGGGPAPESCPGAE